MTRSFPEENFQGASAFREFRRFRECTHWYRELLPLEWLCALWLCRTTV